MHQRAWDFFSTYTFRHDVSLKRSENLMLRLESSLKEQQLEHTLFWVAESPRSHRQAHLHFLIQGEGANSFIYDFYQTRGLVSRRGVLRSLSTLHGAQAFTFPNLCLPTAWLTESANSTSAPSKKPENMPRPKGSPNKVTSETRQFLQEVIEGEHARIRAALAELYESNKGQYLNVLVKILPFVTPKANEVHINDTEMPITTPSWFDTENS